MISTNVYKKRLQRNNPDEVFAYLIDTLKETITKWDYFVNWTKVFKNLKSIEVDLNILNYLIGKPQIKKEFISLLKQHPSVARVIPILVACRKSKYRILSDYGYNDFIYEDFVFQNIASFTDNELKKIVSFASKSGFLKLLASKRIKSVVDYVIGVEVGLDSNGRKNRTGKRMEGIVEFFIKDICTRNKYEYITQATSQKVKEKWNLKLTVDKSSRKIDFAVWNGKGLYLIETNFYGGGGSKLKSTAGEYQTMFDYWKKDGHKFIWVTDGIGWKTTHRPLRETFNHIDHLLNLKMVSSKILEDIITQNI
ncbi:MAG: type II restriction endonuclease [Candidatus Omnitrophica bacterium]|nr:type II restriction endonuclease [Candidatus Omnitrophota bacterium]